MHKCRTYFYIQGTKDIKLIASALHLDIEKIIAKKNGFQIGFCDEYNVIVNEMVKKTLAELFGKEKELLALKKQLNLTYYLVRVPEIDTNTSDPKPLLSLDPSIINFLTQTETIEDLDYYIY